MGNHKRIDVFYEAHIGIGIRWQRRWAYELEISISIPFITLTIGFGKPMINCEG